MIFGVILSIVSFIINGLTAILPTITVFPADLGTNIGTFVGYTYGWGWIFPVGTMYTVFGLIVLLVLVEFTYFTAMYVFSIIHASIRG